MLDVESIHEYLFDDKAQAEWLKVYDQNDEELLFTIYKVWLFAESSWIIEFKAVEGRHLVSKGGTYPDVAHCSLLGVETTVRSDCILTTNEVCQFAKDLTNIENLSPPWEWLRRSDVLVHGCWLNPGS